MKSKKKKILKNKMFISRKIKQKKNKMIIMIIKMMKKYKI